MARRSIPTNFSPTRWRKSSYSGSESGSCLEVQDHHPTAVPVRCHFWSVGVAVGSDATVAAVVLTRRAVEVRVADVLVLVELRGVLDLLLREVDVDLLVVGVDPAHRARREQDVLAEDPYAGVDHQVRGRDVVGVLVDLADAAVGRLNLVADQVGADGVADGRLVAPQVLRHKETPSIAPE
ncbi:protein of unknown function [Streptomyces sp. KY75]|nr:protein of unknown function [Streptomyces sp. KY75]